MIALQYSEQLQEALLRLERTRRQEKRLREESDAILDGLSALVGAASRDEVLSILHTTFQRLIDCRDCWVMYEQGGRLVSEMSNVSFPVGKGFSRVLDGGVLNAFDVSLIPEWMNIEADGVRSALHLPLQLTTSKGMLILTAATRAAFTQESIELARRIIPFSEQAAAKIELIELAHAKEMEEQRKLMRLILDHAPVGIWMLNSNRRMMFINRTFCDAVGIPESRFLEADHYSDILPEAVARQSMASDNACFEERTLIHSRETIPCVDGKEHLFDVIKVPVQSSVGDVSGIVSIAVDMTAQLEIEQEKEQMQQQLLHTQKLESLGILAGGIAHDFNNILAAIMGHAEMARYKSMRDPLAVKQHLQRIVESTDKAADLCKQMLAFSGRGKFIVKPLDISQLIESILNILEVSLNKGVILKLSLTENLPMIEADASQIQQIAMNLITNANEAIDTKSGVISIRTGVMQAGSDYLSQCLCAEDVREGSFVFMEISDTGCGMTSATIKKIFDPFFTTKFTGRGLGMSAVLGIVRGHHGALKLYSEPGQGTTFRVLFPALDYSYANKAGSDRGLLNSNKDAVVLVVDDEESIREMASMMLTDLGISEVLTASDGREALEIYRRERERIDLVLLDLTMPHMDGEETFRQLRLINPAVKVILSSGYSEQSVQDRFAGKGLCGFLQKPYIPDTLQRVVQEAFAKGDAVN